MLVNKDNRIVSEGKADSLGSKVFYDQKMGPGYRVFSRKGSEVSATRKFQIRESPCAVLNLLHRA
ncbi:MAG: hypothetical protein JJE13_01785 [Thermoleophilia bacterium]|nr:hypothetical protein [Thermoleophilia bacterium]